MPPSTKSFPDFSPHAAILEYVVEEISELAGNAAKSSKRAHVKFNYIHLAILGDEELTKVFVINELYDRVCAALYKKYRLRLCAAIAA